MAYVETPDAMQWIAEDRVEAVGVVVISASDTPYVSLDCRGFLQADDMVITAVAAPTEQDSKTIAFSDQDVSDDGKKVSFKVDSNGGADDYTVVVALTLNKGVTNVVRRNCVLRVQ